jgi:hypothetical protein
MMDESKVPDFIKPKVDNRQWLSNPRGPDGRSTSRGDRAISVGVEIEKFGIKEMIDKLTTVQDVHYSKEVLDTQYIIARQAQSYWRSAVYKYYNVRIKSGLETSGQLGRACTFYSAAGRIKFFMTELHHHTASGHSEYSRYIVHGAPSSPGRYSKRTDSRIVNPPAGVHPGSMSNVTRWAAFMMDWRTYVTTLARNMLFVAVSKYLDKRRNIYGFKGLSFEDKNILISSRQPRHGRSKVYGKAEGVKGWKGHYLYGWTGTDKEDRRAQRKLGDQTRFSRLKASIDQEWDMYHQQDEGKADTDIDVRDRNRLSDDIVIEANPWKRRRDADLLEKETTTAREQQRGRNIRKNLNSDPEYADLYADAFEESLERRRRKEYGEGDEYRR